MPDPREVSPNGLVLESCCGQMTSKQAEGGLGNWVWRQVGRSAESKETSHGGFIYPTCGRGKAL